MPLLNLEPAPGWRFAREVWLRSGLGFLGRAWEAVKKRLGLGREVEPRSQLQRDLERALISLKDWLQEEVQVQLLDYRERLKFQYFFPLVDQWLKQQEAGLEDTLGSLLGQPLGPHRRGPPGRDRAPGPGAAPGRDDPRGPGHRVAPIRACGLRNFWERGPGVETPAPLPNPLPQPQIFFFLDKPPVPIRKGEGLVGADPVSAHSVADT